MRSGHKPFEHLFSKLLAGGLSAGLVLAWWPAFFHSEGVMSWVWRGLAWTLLFELLLGALAPLEEAINNHPRYLALKSILRRPFRPISRFTPDSPVASAALLAVGALALPIGLMVSRSDKVNPREPVKLVKVTEQKVVRPVKVVKVTKLVRETQPAQVAPSPAPSPPAPAARPEIDSKPKPKKPPAGSDPEKAPSPEVQPAEPIPAPPPPAN